MKPHVSLWTILLGIKIEQTELIFTFFVVVLSDYFSNLDTGMRFLYFDIRIN